MDGYGQEKNKKRAATSLRYGAPLQTKVWRCCEIEQNAERRRLTKNAEAAHHRCCCTKERAAMPLIRETLPLTWVTAAAHKRHDFPFMNLVALFMLS